MDFESNYDIAASANFIHTHNFTRVALQFPDNLLKHSTRVITALRDTLESLKQIDATESHVLWQLLTTTLPVFCVFGKASICVADCVESMSKYALRNSKPIMVLFGLEYAHSMRQIKEALLESSMSCRYDPMPEVHFADVPSSVMFPSKDVKKVNGLQEPVSDCNGASGTVYSIGGLAWKLPEGQSMDDYLLFWIGHDDSAFANVVLTFNACEIVRYDANENRMVTDLFQQKRILKRRVMTLQILPGVGILVGTLGVAGYLHIINQMMELITGAGKKAYTLVMGRPNPAKLANFPECDVFLYVSCAQTALLDSKEYLAPVITPFEAMIAFNRGSQWTGAYVMEFRDLINLPQMEVGNQEEEARFSFLKGGYVDDFENQEEKGEKLFTGFVGGFSSTYNNAGSNMVVYSVLPNKIIYKLVRETLTLVNATEKALQLQNNSNALMKGNARSGVEFLANRSYQGLNMSSENASPEP
ncbi:2-(3-amino-3-carboxypropyl)histidine synthase subunit 2 [Glycine soja]|uniref:2-(3-amino-3-carboxypropyl)histidine synthase subunit 2 n=1 Tax=Glycine soja TaxID=3848 RepID=A0A445IFC6_GLYSO|nr:2-(3-amino-3-carboxypropyl)histidine synthase subunit 2 [Glycine soja]